MNHGFAAIEHELQIVSSIESLEVALDETQKEACKISIFWPSCIFITSLLVRNTQAVLAGTTNSHSVTKMANRVRAERDVRC